VGLKGKIGRSSTLEGSPNAVSDAWVAQYTPLGAPVWARAYSSHGKLAQVTAAAVDPYGNVVVADSTAHIWLGGSFSLGLETGDETLTTPDGRRDAFLLRLSP
jgi:hypothetical protein